jgi:hypothetical protein
MVTKSVTKKEGWLFVKMTYKGWYASEKWEMRWFSLKSDSLEYSNRKQHVTRYHECE